MLRGRGPSSGVERRRRGGFHGRRFAGGSGPRRGVTVGEAPPVMCASSWAPFALALSGRPRRSAVRRSVEWGEARRTVRDGHSPHPHPPPRRKRCGNRGVRDQGARPEISRKRPPPSVRQRRGGARCGLQQPLSLGQDRARGRVEGRSQVPEPIDLRRRLSRLDPRNRRTTHATKPREPLLAQPRRKACSPKRFADSISTHPSYPPLR